MIFIDRKDLFLLKFHMSQAAHSDLWMPCKQVEKFENTSSRAVSFCPETGQLQLLK